MSDDAPAPDAFERALVEAIAGTTAAADALRAQAADASVVRRDRAPDGVTTYFCVAAGTPRLTDGELTTRVRVVLADAGSPDATAELTVHNGWLDSVSVSVTGAAWPEHPRLAGVTAEG